MSLETPVEPSDVLAAAAGLVQCMPNTVLTISGGAAIVLLGESSSDINDVNIVVQNANVNQAASVLEQALHNFPASFSITLRHGVPRPVYPVHRADGSVAYLDIVMIGAEDWPQLYRSDNESTTTVIQGGVEIPVFTAGWLLREQMTRAYEFRNSQKEATYLDDARTLMRMHNWTSVDMSAQSEEVSHYLRRWPDDRSLLELRVRCLQVLGNPWKWSPAAEVHWRWHKGGMHYLDKDCVPREFKYNGYTWYFTIEKKTWFYDDEDKNLALWPSSA